MFRPYGCYFFVCLQCLTIYIAGEAITRMRIDYDRIARRRAREADQERVRLAERERLREIEQERSREAERRQRVRDQRRRAAEQKMEEENIKKQTLAPLPAVIDRRDDVPLSRYEYNDISEADGVYRIGDATYKAFLNDVGDLIKKQDINMDKFNQAYFHLICAADSLWAWCHEQIETIAFNSKFIMQGLILALGMPAELAKFDKSTTNFRFMKYYFRQWRKAWFDIKDGISSTELSAEESLWAYFKYWFCDFRMGPIICHRAELVAMEFEFSSKPAEQANKEPSYALKKYLEMEEDLVKLYEYEKGIKRQAVKRKDSKKIAVKGAVVYNDSNQLNDDDNDVIDDNLATAGGDRQAISDESPATTANKKDHQLKETKDLEASIKKAVDEFEYEYSEEEEEAEEQKKEVDDIDDDDDDDDKEWNDCDLREDEDDDMSLCGGINPSETGSLVAINFKKC